jgi:hypothetical protein
MHDGHSPRRERQARKSLRRNLKYRLTDIYPPFMKAISCEWLIRSLCQWPYATQEHRLAADRSVDRLCLARARLDDDCVLNDAVQA